MSYIVAPCLGGLIGYITNDIAIRMLFHPHKAKYIMGWHVPVPLCYYVYIPVSCQTQLFSCLMILSLSPLPFVDSLNNGRE